MARRKQDVDIGINAKDNASRTVKKVESSFTRLGNYLKNNWKAIAAAAAAATAAYTFALKKSLDQADAYEDALVSLTAAMEANGDASSESVASMVSFADELQRSANIANTASLEMLALANSFGATGDEAQRMVKVAADFAVAAKVSLEESLRRIGRGSKGATGDLANFVDSLRGVGPEAASLTVVLDAIDEKFGGMAESAADTSKGIREGLLLDIKDLQRSFGTALTENEKFIQALSDLRDTVSDPKTAESIKGLTGDVVSLTTAFKDFAQFQASNAPDVQLIGYFADLAKKLRGAWEGMKEFGKQALSVANEGLPKLTSETTKYAEAIERASRIQKFWEDELGKVNSLANDLGVTLENQVNTQLEDYEKRLLVAQAAERDGIIQRHEVIRLEEAFAEKKRELNEQLVDEADATNDATEALDSYTESALRATEQVTDLQQATEAATESAREASTQFGENLLGGRSTFSQLSGGTFSVPQPQVRTNRFGRVG